MEKVSCVISGKEKYNLPNEKTEKVCSLRMLSVSSWSPHSPNLKVRIHIFVKLKPRTEMFSFFPGSPTQLRLKRASMSGTPHIQKEISPFPVLFPLVSPDCFSLIWTYLWRTIISPPFLLWFLKFHGRTRRRTLYLLLFPSFFFLNLIKI